MISIQILDKGAGVYLTKIKKFCINYIFFFFFDQ